MQVILSLSVGETHVVSAETVHDTDVYDDMTMSGLVLHARDALQHAITLALSETDSAEHSD